MRNWEIADQMILQLDWLKSCCVRTLKHEL